MYLVHTFILARRLAFVYNRYQLSRVKNTIDEFKWLSANIVDGDVIGDQALFASLYLESNRLSKLVEQLEQLKEWDYLSAQSVVKKESHEIKDLLSQSVAMFERTCDRKNSVIQLKVDSCNLTIHIEGIQQVISNLLDNAIRYYEGTGPIVLTGERFTEQK